MPRVYMFALIFMAPCSVIYLDKLCIIRYDFNKCVAILLVISPNISGVITCIYCVTAKTNEPIKNVVNYLVENNLTFGLTTFWNTGVPTEISDGQIELVNISETDITSIRAVS